MELLTFVNMKGAATITTIQSYMLATYGLKFKTTSEMVQELAISGSLKADGHGFYHLTDNQQGAFKRMVAQEQKEKEASTLLRRIATIKDKKTRKKAMDLYDALLNNLPDENAEEQQQI